MEKQDKKTKKTEVLKLFVTNEEGDLEIIEVELSLKKFLIEKLDLLSVPTKKELVELVEIYSVK
jgi:hypothetical protein